MRDAHCLQRRRDSFANERGGKATYGQCPGHIVLHDGRNDLVIWILEDDTYIITNCALERTLPGIHARDQDVPIIGEQERVTVTSKRRFAATVMAQHGNVLALLYLQTQMVEARMDRSSWTFFCAG